MSEFDELSRLRDADPAKNQPVPSAEDARALRERIMVEAPSQQRDRRRFVVLGAAAAVALIVAGAIVVATRGGGSGEPKSGQEPITSGQASCVEQYSLDTLKHRAVALDGTVERVSGDDVTFKVNEWFKGGNANEVTLKGAETLGAISSVGDPLPLDPGSRLLVSGDGGFAWMCGFTQRYDARVADQWREALR